MSRAQLATVLLLLAGIGIYGCSKNSSDYVYSDGSPASTSKAQRWEEDYKSAAAARDQYRQKLIAAEDKQAELQRQLDQERASASLERDTLKAELRQRLSERDSLQAQYDGFRKGLKELLAQAESTLANPSMPNIPTIPTLPSIPAVPGSSPAPATIGAQPAAGNGALLSN